MGKNGGRQTLSKEMLEAIAEKAAESEGRRESEVR